MGAVAVAGGPDRVIHRADRDKIALIWSEGAQPVALTPARHARICYADRQEGEPT